MKRARDVTLELVHLSNRDEAGSAVDLVHVGSPVSTMLTLCGWWDVESGESQERVPTCPSCLSVVQFCKALAGPGVDVPAPAKRKPKRKAKR